ncbi:thioredoxin domain-containing protein 17-like [Chironomus tepperi]|uniref:thioredoxin domain-containing protein 17-like n=1 Tax=Chironomus tepperi TaxID=113505 RepID=UPI00391F8972
MVKRHFVKNWDEFEKLVVQLEKDKLPINVFFTGDKDESGESWCPYCTRAKPVVEEALKNSAPEDSHFITCEIDKPFWRNQENPFRKDTRTHLVFLPTLLRWKAPQRLDGSQVADADLVAMLLEDED